MTQNSKKTKAQLVEELTALGVNASMSLKKDELVALLDAQSGGGSGEGSGIKPSTPLAGQEDLANRTLDWKYQAPAEDSADAAPSAAPEFVAAAEARTRSGTCTSPNTRNRTCDRCPKRGRRHVRNHQIVDRGCGSCCSLLDHFLSNTNDNLHSLHNGYADYLATTLALTPVSAFLKQGDRQCSYVSSHSLCFGLQNLLKILQNVKCAQA